MEKVNDLKLYSLNQARIILKIGIRKLNHYIDAGLIGVVPPPPGYKQKRIPLSEIVRFLPEQTIREQKQIITRTFTNPDVDEFINRNNTRKKNMKNFDSDKLFNQILENNNGKRI